ncbi:WD40 repeat-like protein [Anaeromyces robustus]|uniref:WD40 repeat-like protein n=1 Tax=Anaeromyces robustus TaxID=1754192 RepID=A0A1Y1WW02_9FUNG|nr:WD40 repeat-like protein [Anaeromyces robustus]|eukprot:ORX77693.1 WD40 repeat-like protein [Anaeromyces robustus]
MLSYNKLFETSSANLNTSFNEELNSENFEKKIYTDKKFDFYKSNTYSVNNDEKTYENILNNKQKKYDNKLNDNAKNNINIQTELLNKNYNNLSNTIPKDNKDIDKDKKEVLKAMNWWDNTKNRSDEIQRVKELLRSNTELIQDGNNSEISNNKNKLNDNSNKKSLSGLNNIINNINDNVIYSHSEKNDINDTKIMNSKLQRMKLIQQRNSSSSIKELLTFNSDNSKEENNIETNIDSHKLSILYNKQKKNELLHTSTILKELSCNTEHQSPILNNNINENEQELKMEKSFINNKENSDLLENNIDDKNDLNINENNNNIIKKMIRRNRNDNNAKNTEFLNNYLESNLKYKIENNRYNNNNNNFVDDNLISNKLLKESKNTLTNSLKSSESEKSNINHNEFYNNINTNISNYEIIDKHDINIKNENGNYDNLRKSDFNYHYNEYLSNNKKEVIKNNENLVELQRETIKNKNLKINDSSISNSIEYNLNPIGLKNIDNKEYNTNNNKKYEYYDQNEERLHVSPSAIKLIMNYLHHYGYDHSVEVIKNETGIGANAENYRTLKQLINKKEFEKAIKFSKEVYESKSTSENRFKSSYEDLLYILNKYLLLKFLQEKKKDKAISLFDKFICSHIQQEIEKGGSRAEWFIKDHKLLSTLINIDYTTEIEKFNTFFNSWNWEKEINQFWEYGIKAYKSSYNLTKSSSSSFSSSSFSHVSEEQTNIPLFSYVLAAYFLEEDEILNNNNYKSSYKILDNINEFSKEMKSTFKKNRSNIYIKNIDENFNNTLVSVSNNHLNVNAFPLISNDNETSSFIFSSCIGPMMGTIRALDIKLVPSTNQIIGACANGDDRGDRKISLWDLNTSSLITQLDNKTSKTVLTLSFHPVWEDILLSSDMEFDVKLWNWKTGKLLRIWKKHHTRIIHKTDFIPGNYEMAVSCSSDQSIKIWNVTNEDSKITSIHSNEPFTSFTFWGDGHNQVLVTSLNYSLKLYKLRTSSLLHSIILPDLKSNKTPITSITSHPIQNNYILISSDNKLLLFDLQTSTILKTYSAREILPGQRIQGEFSPCGNYIYSGCADVKSFDSRRTSLLTNSNNSTTNINPSTNNDDYKESSMRNNTTGIFIWKLQTGKLERNDMTLMEDSVLNNNVGIYPVTLCKWIEINNETNKKENETLSNNISKILISGSLDRYIKIFTG